MAQRKHGWPGAVLLAVVVALACGCSGSDEQGGNEPASEERAAGPGGAKNGAATGNVPAKTGGIQEHLAELMARKDAAALTIEKTGTDDLVQVAHDQEGTTVLLNYPFAGPAARVLSEAGVSVPAGWKLDGFEQGVYAQYDATGSTAQEIADFVKAFFTKAMKTDPDGFYVERM